MHITKGVRAPSRIACDSAASLFPGERDKTAFAEAQSDAESLKAMTDGTRWPVSFDRASYNRKWFSSLNGAVNRTLLTAGRDEIDAATITRAIHEGDPQLIAPKGPVHGLTLKSIGHD